MAYDPDSNSQRRSICWLEAVIPCQATNSGGRNTQGTIRISEFERGVSFAIVGGRSLHRPRLPPVEDALEEGSDHIRGQVVRSDSGECASEAAERDLYCAVRLSGGHSHSDSEEHAEEAVSQCLVATHRATVEAAERG